MRRNRGAVLIIVLGVLAVLALLATTFATLSGVESRVSRNYLDTVRAKLLAQSGINDALAHLERDFPGRCQSSVLASQSWKFRGNTADVGQAPSNLPLDEARYPSYSWKFEEHATDTPANPAVQADSVTVEGRKLGFSGVTGGGAYGIHGDHYALKVSDLSGRMYLNDGVDGGPQASVSQNLRRLLNILGRQTKPKIADLGDRILAKRPERGYQEIGELKAFFSPQEFDAFHDFVTVKAWVDTTVANPVPLSQRWVQEEKRGGNPMPEVLARARNGLYRLGKSKDAQGELLREALTTCPKVPHDDPAIRVYGLDSLNPQWIEIASRAPVNINSARREVLITLLADLRGRFLSDRRRNNPNWTGGNYGAFAEPTHLSPDFKEGSEYGYLMETVPIVFNESTGTVTATTGIDAGSIADEIIACRSKKATRHFDYAKVTWSGPFKTWRQFNVFVDNLARPKVDNGAGLLQDDRAIFFDFPESGGDSTGYGALMPSELQRRHAVQAIADVLKANFNPNLHLSILNPDENLYTIVDKTMLSVSSTEFTFIPTGYFEIESIGRVLRPVGTEDSFTAGNNELVAQAKVRAVCKLYEIHRETSQKDFYEGTLSDRTAATETNNNKSLEIGPEPDNGLAAKENEWGGYIALPTVGGVYHDRAVARAPGSLTRTMGLESKSQFRDAYHVHFTFDHDAHHHTLGPDARQELASRTLPNENIANFPDALPDGTDVGYPGPYGPAAGPEAGATDYGPTGIDSPLPRSDHRLAKAFRLKPQSASTNSYPSLTPYAPSDLRIDGAYSERHAAPAYYVGQAGKQLWNWDTEQARGMISFWYKPSFSPDRTGKIRKLFDFSRWHQNCPQNCHVYPWTLIFFPAHYQPDIADVGVPFYRGEAIGRFRPCSLVWGHTEWHHAAPAMSWFGNISTCLNHIGHSDEVGKSAFAPAAERMERLKQNPWMAHRWINLTASWSLRGQDFAGTGSKMLINGSTSMLPFNWTTMRPGDPATITDKIYLWEKHDGGEANHMRLGGTSKIGDKPGMPYRGNHTSDGTIDEFYVWKNETDADPKALWERGRYANPSRGSGASGKGDAAFTSKAVDLLSGLRVLAPPAGQTTTAGGAAWEKAQVQVLGLSWTWYGETQDENGKPVMYDYNSNTGSPIRELEPKVQLGIVDGEGASSISYGPWDDDGYSPVETTTGSCPTLLDPQKLRWRARFRIGGANVATILLATPVLDDVTVFWRRGGATMISYVYDNRSF